MALTSTLFKITKLISLTKMLFILICEFNEDPTLVTAETTISIGFFDGIAIAGITFRFIYI